MMSFWAVKVVLTPVRAELTLDPACVAGAVRAPVSELPPPGTLEGGLEAALCSAVPLICNAPCPTWADCPVGV